MNKLSIRTVNFRTKVYVGIVVFAILAVFTRMILVQIERGRPIISFVSECSRYGKPVTAKEIHAADVPVYTQFTVRTGSDGLASGFVTADIRNKLKEGQDVYLADSDILCGTISNIGQELDLNTGMFSIGVKFNVPAATLGSTSIVFARTQILQKVLVVPNEILDISEGDYYIWKIESGKARKIKVKVDSRDSYGAVIVEGVQSGDLIVYGGQSQLKDNEKVNIIYSENNAEANNKDKRQ